MLVGSYEILGEVARGGAGVVYLARRGTGPPFALKVLPRLSGPQARERFERELRVLEALGAERGFVPVLDSGESPQGSFVVMPLLEGGTLRARLERGPLAVDEAVGLGRALAAALGEAHARGLVHRDLKPENVLFTRRPELLAGTTGPGFVLEPLGRPLVVDLGLAKHFSRDVPGASRSVSLSRTGDFRGTVGYMAPEQVEDPRSVDGRADVYSLGAILWECLAGKPLRAGATLMEVLGQAQEGVVPSLAAERPDVPGWLAAVVERALAPRAADRFEDGAALERALAPGSHEGREPAGRGHATPLLALGLVLALLSALGLGAAVALKVGRASGGEVQESGSKVAPLVREGIRLFEEADDAGALDRATRALALDPRDPSALALHSLALWLRHDHERARAEAEEAVARGGGLALPHVALGASWIHRNDVGAASAEALRAVELDRGLALAWDLRAVARESDLAAGIKDLTEALRLAPSFVRALASRASLEVGVAERVKDPAEREALEAAALADANEAVSRRADCADAWVSLAAVRDARGERAETHAAIERALGLDPKLVRALRIRCYLRVVELDLDGAWSDATAALELQPTLGWPRILESRILRHRKRPKEAVPLAQDATRRLPTSVEAWFERAGAEIDAGDLETAFVDMDRVLALDPDHPNALASRCMRRFETGDARGAVLDGDRAFALGVRDRRFLLQWCRALEREGLFERALVAANVALGVPDPYEPMSLHGIKAEAFIASDRFAEAEAEATRAVDLELPHAGDPARAPARSSFYSLRAEARRNLGKVDEALADADTALELEGTNAHARVQRGWLRSAKGDARGAIEDLETALASEPAAPGSDKVRAEIDRLRTLR